MTANPLQYETIWFDKIKFAEAERKYYEQIAQGGDAMVSAEVLQQISSLQSKVESLTKLVATLEVTVRNLEAKSGSAASPAAKPQARTPSKVSESKSAAAAADDDDIDLFGSDEEEDAEAAKIREDRLKAYAEKKSTKKAVIAKSNVILDIKPWDDETDMAAMEKQVRTIVMEGLLWGAGRLVPLAYGIKKLQISCVVEDDKVSVEELTEKIEEFEDFVQSVDIAAFNKI